jgi:N6-adenosine-specific RNA methylase IME4
MSLTLAHEYKQEMENGRVFPPVEVVAENGHYWLWDGYHRKQAAEMCEFTEIEANVQDGTLQDAEWLALSANKDHGWRRTNADKREAVRLAFLHPNTIAEFEKTGDVNFSFVANHCGVTSMFVGNMWYEEHPKVSIKDENSNGLSSIFSESLIYFLYEKSSHRVKIGLTKNLNKRIDSLQTGNSSQLLLAGVILGEQPKEAEIHAKFDHLRVNGEWFSCSNELIKFINSNRQDVFETASTTKGNLAKISDRGDYIYTVDLYTRPDDLASSNRKIKPPKDASLSPPVIAEAVNLSLLDKSSNDLEQLAKLPEAKQAEVVAKLASDEATTVNAAKKLINQEQKREVTLAEEIQGQFSVIYADPPWQYDNNNLGGAAELHYPTISTADICQMPVKDIATTNAVLFLWVTNPFLPDGLQVMKAWGFEYKTNFVWIKNRSTYGQLGFYNFGQHELLFVGTRGSFLPVDEGKVKSIIDAAKAEHSRKPDITYDIIEGMYPNHSYLEIFSRTTRQGWEMFGNEKGQNERQ